MQTETEGFDKASTPVGTANMAPRPPVRRSRGGDGAEGTLSASNLHGGTVLHTSLCTFMRFRGTVRCQFSMCYSLPLEFSRWWKLS